MRTSKRGARNVLRFIRGQKGTRRMNTFPQALTRLDKYIWYMSHRFESSMRGMEVSDLHQEGLIKLYEVYSSAEYADKPFAELDAIFKAALYNTFTDLYHRSKRESGTFIDVDLEVIAEEWGIDGFNATYLAHYQAHLNQFLSTDAAVLLDTLLHPTPAVYHLANIQRMRRQALQGQGRTMRVPTKLTQSVVGSALGFSEPKTKALIRELQQTWRVHGCQNNCMPNAHMS